MNAGQILCPGCDPAEGFCAQCRAVERARLSHIKPRPEMLDLALVCGAVLTGKPDGSEPITVVFSIEAWREFDATLYEAKK